MDFFSSSRHCFVNELELEVSAARLFSSLKRAEDWPLWVDAIAAVEWTTPPPFAVGTTRTVTFTNGKFADELFIAWEENRRMAFCFTGTDMPGTGAFAEDYLIEPLGEECCRLVWRVAFSPLGIHRWVFRLFGFAINKIFIKALADLKRFIEA